MSSPGPMTFSSGSRACSPRATTGTRTTGSACAPGAPARPTRPTRAPRRAVFTVHTLGNVRRLNSGYGAVELVIACVLRAREAERTDLMNCDTVVVSHLVELVHAAHATVGEHHGARLQSPVAGVVVLRNGCRQADAGGAAAGGRYRERCDTKDKAQQLAFRCRRVAGAQV